MKKLGSILFFILIMIGCFKTDLRPKRHVNKLSCYVNGILWEATPNYEGFSDIPIPTLYFFKSPFFDVGQIYANNEKKNQTINIIFNFNDTTKFSQIRGDYPLLGSGYKCFKYNLDSLTDHTIIIIQNDTVKRIATGRFSFRAIGNDSGCQDTVTITKGYFDMNY
jgi:hypothetical protein